MAIAPTAALLPSAQLQFCDSNGNPLSLGSVGMYYPNTTSLKTTWKDPNQVVVNQNPVPLDGAGRATIYGAGQYTMAVMDVNGTVVFTGLTEDSISLGPVISPAVAPALAASTAAQALFLLGGGLTEASIAAPTVAAGGMVYVATAALTLTLPQSTTVTPHFFFFLTAFNGDVTVVPTVPDQIDGGGSGVGAVIAHGLSAAFTTDGNGEWYTLFYGGPPLATPVPIVLVGGQSGNIVIPANCYRLEYEGWAGGGAGGSSESGSAGGGGGSGAYIRSSMPVVPGQIIAYSVGLGGALATTGVNNGGAGGATTFGVATAGGGQGGVGVATGTGAGGAGGVASGTTSVAFNGQQGGPGIISGGLVLGGQGAGAYGQPGPAFALGGVGAELPGAGGTGAIGTINSGAGAPGLLYVLIQID